MAFKKDFLWGSSSSAYQFEGAYNEDGKGLSVQDTKPILPNTPDFKVASDHYHHFKEDVKLLGEMGLKSYRFSIAWSRIFPDGYGQINEKGLKFYDDLINELLKYNIEPLVTMYHFDLPSKIDEEGGWSNPKTIDYFLDYSRILFERYGDRVKYWLTINEQNMMVLHSKNVIKERKGINIYKENHHMLLAQAKAMILCHKMLKGAKIGPAPNICYVYPNSNDPKDVLASQYWSSIRNWLYLDVAVYGRYNDLALNFIRSKGYELEISKEDLEIFKAAKPDFIALNYYVTSTVSANYNDRKLCSDQQSADKEVGFFQGVHNDKLPFTEFGWQIDPLGFRITLQEVYARYHLPIIITENGLGAKDYIDENGQINDDYRIDYLRKHIENMHEAICSGVEVLGYYTWSAFDLISTHQGFDKRYGFIYVNRDNYDLKDLKRYKKKSFYWYKELIERNGEI